MQTSVGAAKEHNYSFDFLRVAAMLGVILYHSAAAYSVLSPYWPVQDGRNILGDGLRELLVVFIMPFFFFAAGFFVLPSLQNNSLTAFLGNKARRLGAYWLFAVLVIIPFFESKLTQIPGGYFEYWIRSLLNFRDAWVGPLSRQYNNMHFWFISLLLYVYILAGILYAVLRDRGAKWEMSSPPGKIPWTSLGLFALLALAVDYAFLLLVPDADWVVVPNVIQFNINQLPTMLLYFGFGMSARSRGWFLQNNLPGKPIHWIAASAAATAAYFLVGREFFGNLTASNTLSPAYLLIFSLVRSSLLLVYLLATLSAGTAFFSRKNPMLHELAGVSYEIYLVHLFIVVALQMALAELPSVPGEVKIAVTLFAATGLSYLLGKFTIHKHPKASAAVMLALFLAMPLLFGPD